MALVSKRQLPFSFGSPHPRVAVVEQDGVFRIRALVVDQAEAEAASREAFAKHQRWMPEDFYELGRPTGTIFVEAETADALLEKMKTMDWPSDW